MQKKQWIKQHAFQIVTLATLILLILSLALYPLTSRGLNGTGSVLNTLLTWVLFLLFAALGVHFIRKAPNNDILYVIFLWLIYALFMGSLEYFFERSMFLLYSLLSIPLCLFYKDKLQNKYTVFSATVFTAIAAVVISKLPLLFWKGGGVFVRAAYIYSIAAVIGYYLVNLIFVPSEKTAAGELSTGN